MSVVNLFTNDERSSLKKNLRPAVESVQARPALHYSLCLLLLTVLYYTAGALDQMTADQPGTSGVVGLAAGVGLSAVLLFGYRMLPAIWLGATAVSASFLIEPATGFVPISTLLVSAALATGATVQGFVSACLINRFIGTRRDLTKSKSILTFLLLGGPVGCLVGATCGILVLTIAHIIPSQYSITMWIIWWCGDIFGVLVVTPLAMTFLAQPRFIWRDRRWGITVSLVAVLFGALLVNAYLRQQEVLGSQLEFERRALVSVNALDKETVRYLDVLHSVHGFFASADHISREDFRQFSSAALARLPGIQALSWNPLIRHENRSTVEQAVRAEGIKKFELTELDDSGRRKRAENRSEYVTVHFIEPYIGNENALGFDVSSNPVRRYALNRARDTGEMIATARIKLVQEAASQTGMLVFLPFYGANSVPTTVIDRQATLQGYIVGVLRLGDMVASALNGINPENAVIRLFDQTDNSNPLPLVVYRNDTESPGKLMPLNYEPQEGVMRQSSYLSIAGRQWRIEYSAGNAHPTLFPASIDWLIAVIGALLAGFVAAFVLLVTGRHTEFSITNQNLKREIDNRLLAEHALFEEKERAQITLRSIGDAVITTDAEANIDYLNPAAEQLTGWPIDDARDQSLHSIFRLVGEDSEESISHPLIKSLVEGKPIAKTPSAVLIDRNDKRCAVQASAAPLKDEIGQIRGTVIVFQDVAEQRRLMRKISWQATHDALTGLITRHEFEERLQQALESARKERSEHCVCFIDLDQFKVVNDTCGHMAGDELLRQVTALFNGHVRKHDSVARLGGDEFGVLLEHCSLEKAHQIADGLRKVIERYRFHWESNALQIGLSIGLVSVSHTTEDVSSVLCSADRACYAAKEDGRNRVQVYSESDADLTERHKQMQWVARLQTALDDNRFRLFVQRIVPINPNSSHRKSYELLLRMVNETGELVSPGAFLPAAERYHFASKIDRWVIKRALAWLSLNHEQLQHVGSVSINLSGQSLGDRHFESFVLEQLDSTYVPGELLCFEITETAAITNLSHATRFINTLRARQCRFSLDDFGSGLSSFAYLKNLPIDYLKIDGQFVRDIVDNPVNRAMVRSINDIGHVLGKTTIAEYVENGEILSILQTIGVDYAQGFGIGKPQPIEILLSEAKSKLDKIWMVTS